MTHCAPTPLLFSLISIYVPDTHPASTSPSLTGAHRPFGVVLAGLEGERLPRVEQLDVQDLPVLRAVGRKDAWGANPELDQEIWLEGWGHPRMVQIWWRGHKNDEGVFFFTFFSKLYECSKIFQGHKERKGLGLEKTSKNNHKVKFDIGLFLATFQLKHKHWCLSWNKDGLLAALILDSFYFYEVVPLSKEAPLAKLMKFVPPFEVSVTLRLDTVLACGKNSYFRFFLSQRAASEGTWDAKDSGMLQSYTLGWLISSCSPVVQKKLDLKQTTPYNNIIL